MPELIDTALTRYEERYAQALEVGGKVPTGDLQKDKENARKALKSQNTAWSPVARTG